MVCWSVGSIVEEDAEVEELAIEYEEGGWEAIGLLVNLILAIIRSMGHKSL